MRDVAALAGLGVMTVSRVVNGRDGVSAERAARVWRAIEQLDYPHNIPARPPPLTRPPPAVPGGVLEDVAHPVSAGVLGAGEKPGCEQDSPRARPSSPRDAPR